MHEIPCNNSNKSYIDLKTQYLGRRLNCNKHNDKETIALKRHTVNFETPKIPKKEQNYSNLMMYVIIHTRQN